MSLFGSDGEFQELFGQNSATQTQDIHDLEVIDSLILDYATPNKNLVTDGDNKVITEDKDSFVDVPNQITFTQVGRQFTPALPQDIASTSDVDFKTVTIGTSPNFWSFETSGSILELKYNSIGRFSMGTNFNPETTDFQNLGASSQKWNYIYVNNIGSAVSVEGDLTMTNSSNFILNSGSQIYFGDVNNAMYSNGTNIIFRTNGTDRFFMTPTSFYSRLNSTLGSVNDYWGNAYLGNRIYMNGNLTDTNADIFFDPSATNGISGKWFNQIRFKVNNTEVVLLGSNGITPLVSGYDLGSVANEFDNIFSSITNCSDRLQFRENQSYIKSNADTQLNFYTGNTARLTLGSSFIYPPNISYDLGVSSQKFRDLYLSNDVYADGSAEFNTSSSGYVSMNELKSVDYEETPTDDAFVTIIGKNQFLRARGSGTPSYDAGFMCSRFDTSNFYIYNNSTGNLRISYNALLTGVGGGHSNATTCVDIRSDGELIATNLSSTQQSQVEYWLDQENAFTLSITSTNIYQGVDISSQTVSALTTNFTSLGGAVDLRYDGTETRKFLVKYKIIGRRATTGTKLFYTRIRRLNAVDGSRTEFAQSKAYQRLSTTTTVCFSGEAIVQMLTNDRILLEIKNATDSTNFIMNSLSIMAYDLNYLGD